MAERSQTHRGLALTAGLLGALAAAVGNPYPDRRGASTERPAASVTALELARWLREGRRGLRLLDIRSDRQFVAYHIPGAEHVAASDLSGRRATAHETVVIYAEDAAAAERAARMLRERGGDARVLRAGLRQWIEQIAEPRLPPLPPTASAAERAARRDHLDVSRYFGGMPVVSPAAPATTRPRAATVPVSSRQVEASAVARILRRGC